MAETAQDKQKYKEKLDKKLDKTGSTVDRMMVKIGHLDKMLNLVGEVIITSNNLSTLYRRLQKSYDERLEVESGVVEDMKASALTANRISSDLHHLVMDIRMVEIRETFYRFRRVVRDLAKDKGLEVDLQIVGEDTLVDKTIAEKLYDSLNHQIRNAVDHGLENPVERKSSGKPATCRVVLRAEQKENFTLISVEDDGKGLDPEIIARKAMERGMVDAAKIATMNREEIYNLIFEPGFSTKEAATRVSGRGVGMDIVKTHVMELGGEVIISSEVGKGSVFTYKIPQLTAVNIMDALTVRAGKNYFAIPILHVVSTLGISAKEVHTTMRKGQAIMYLGELVTLRDLNELLRDPPLENTKDYTIVIVEDKVGRLALRVSELLTPEKLVFAPLQDIVDVPGISGTTVMGSNRLGLVLDTLELITMSQGSAKPGGVGASAAVAAAAAAMAAAQADAAITAAEEKPAAGKKEEEKELTDEEKAYAAEEKQALASFKETGMEILHEVDFFQELEDIVKEANLVALELEKDPGNMELVNNLFRHFHSMKGNMLMVGLARAGNYLHQVETILDKVREGKIDINSDIVDIILDSTDMVKDYTKALRDGKTPSVDADLIERVQRYKVEDTKEVKKKAEGTVLERSFELNALAQFTLAAKRAQGHALYQVYFKFAPEGSEKKSSSGFITALLILKRMSRYADIVSTVPSIEEIESEQVDTDIKVMFVTKRAQAEIEGFFKDKLVRYYDVTKYEIITASEA